jgi:tetratricopeptide (TPR) repeat protein
MKTHCLRFNLRLFLLAAVFCVGSAARADGPQWIEVRSPHFSVVTDAGEKRGREVAMRFEQMRGVFAILMAKGNVNIPVPLQIVAFRNTKELRQFAPLWHGKPTQLAGLFQGGEDRSFIMLDMSVDNPWSVVFHEYAHQLMSGTLAQHTDPWFEEGFAEFFSTIEVDNKEAKVGKPSEQSYLVLQQAGWIRVADLLKVRHNSQTYNESGDRRSVFYAESNMLVHYIYDNQAQLLPKVGAYFDLTHNKRVPVEDAIQQAFGMSPAQLDKTLSDYVRRGQYKYYPIPTPANIVAGGFTTAPLSAADTSAVMADIHLHSIDYRDKAIDEFQEILKSDGNNAAALRGLGYAYLQKREFKEAADYFRRAAQLDSTDPRVHYYSALLMNREGGFANRAKLPEMIKELEAAIALDPNFAEPYSLLGFAQSFDGYWEKGLANMQKAIALSPRNTWYQFNLAQMYLNHRQPDQAIPLLEALKQAPDQQVALRAGESLARAQQLKAMLERGVQFQQLGPVHARDDAGEADEPPSPTPAKTGQSSPSATTVKFMKGLLTSVDCAASPSAVLTVVSGTSTWKMKVADLNRVVLMGADKFSCSWTKQKVAVNYVETGSGEGRVISLELQ